SSRPLHSSGPAAPSAPQTMSPPWQRSTPVAQTPAAVRAELAETKREVERLTAELAESRAARQEVEGKPHPFPADVGAEYRAPKLLGVFSDAIERLGIDGEVESIDCAEFPCLVYGRYTSADAPTAEADLQRLFQETKARYPDARFYIGKSVETEAEGGEALARFSFAYWPPLADDEAEREAERRMRFRKNEYHDADR
ncbi:MAG: hypothetical protein KC620_23645, partial [Myxococcales bacterium]|nr:hypothetical protein [Myxococcales bacterium]